MRGYLVYESWEGEKNRGFIRMFEEEGERRGISFSYVSLEEYRTQEPVDIVLNRTRRPEVSNWYEERGSIVLHDSTVVEVANDKWKSLVYLVKYYDNMGTEGHWEEKWMPDTLYLPGEAVLGDTVFPCIRWRKNRECLEYQALGEFLREHPAFVIKTVSGHGGAQVARVDGESFHAEMMEKKNIHAGELLRMIEEFRGRFLSQDVILQEEIACRSRDVRMYILGNEFYQGVLRQGKQDFRSNFSLGGEVSVFIPSRKQEEQMRRILRGFGKHTLGMAGMDFLLGEDGRIYFNELEEMAGCRMLFQTTERNIVADYVEWMLH